MSLLKKLFGRTEKNNSLSQPERDSLSARTPQELIEIFGGVAFEKQLHFGDIIGTNNWSVDIAKSTITFGADLVFPLQVLGTFSHATETWLWAWANTKSGLPQTIIEQSLQLKKYGEENSIDLLKNDTFSFSKHEMHLIGLIASGMLDSSGYYIADYGQGAMLMTVKSNRIDNTRTDQHLRILTVFPQLISQFDMNHKKALLNYLKAKKYLASENGSVVTGSRDGNTITAQFDQAGRLTNLKG